MLKALEENINKRILNKFQNRLLLVFTREVRDSYKIIKSLKTNNTHVIKKYDEIKKLANSFEYFLKNEEFNSIGNIFHDHWQIKRKLSPKISSSYLDNMYLKLMEHQSFVGGKIIGAGGGGFFLMLTKSKKDSENYLRKNKFFYKNIILENIGSMLLKS